MCLPKVQENFYLQPAELWKTPSREKKISEHDITQHTKIPTEIRFFFVYHKLGICNRNKWIDFG